MTIDIDAVEFRNQDHDCTLNRQVINAAQGYSKPGSPLVEKAATIYLMEYDPEARPAPLAVYYAPHFPGKPEKFFIQYQSGECEGLPLFS